MLEIKKTKVQADYLVAEMGSVIAIKYAMLSIPIMMVTDRRLQIISRFATPGVLAKLL
jgi:hypothetical protein